MRNPLLGWGFVFLRALEGGLALARVACSVAGARRPHTVERCEWREGFGCWPAWAACVPGAALSCSLYERLCACGAKKQL